MSQPFTFPIPREVLEIYRFAAVDPYRDHMRRILICPNDQKINGFCAVATDGHSLMVVRWPSPGEPPKAFSFRSWLFRVALLEDDGESPFEGVLDSSGLALTVRSDHRTYSAPCNDGETYPTWRKAMADQRKAGTDPANRISLNPTKLMVLGKYLRACDIEGSHTRWSVPSDTLAGVRIDFDSGDIAISYVLMPCHVDDWTAK